MGDRAWDIITIRNAMDQAMKPQFADFKTKTLKPYQQMMWEMMTDPSKRGYDQGTKDLMFGRQADALTGAKTSYMRNLSKDVAASGMGDGSMRRGMAEYAKEHMANLRGAGRDVELADAEAKRNDLWNAVSGYQTGANMEMQNRGAEQDFWNSEVDASRAYSGLAQSEGGFWKNFKNSLGSSLGSGLGNLATGGGNKLPWK